MKKLNKLAVFCGSNVGKQKEYLEAAHQLAESLVSENIQLVYGGGRVGIMGFLADKVLDLGGEVMGVIPGFMVEQELVHTGLTELHVVNTMHERKTMMNDIAEGFLMLPGGPGSLDEFFEIFTLARLKLHTKPFGILNVKKYFDLLISFINHMTLEGFLTTSDRDFILIEEHPHQLIQKILRGNKVAELVE